MTTYTCKIQLSENYADQFRQKGAIDREKALNGINKHKLIFIVLILTSLFSFGQIAKKRFVSTFSQFSLAKHSDSTAWEIRTDKIKFLKNNHLDTSSSKLYLDSICLFLSQHPTAVVEILLKKDDSFGNEYRHSKIAQLQTQQIVDYIIKRGVDQQRLLGNAIKCGPLIITDEHPKDPAPKKTNIIVTSIRVLNEDFKDPNRR